MLEKDVLAKLIINYNDIPLNDANKRHITTWLRQMASELEDGEHWGSAMFQIRIPKK